MQTLTELIVDAGMADKLLTKIDLINLLDGTPAKRYALVNKALRQGELIKVTRGLYFLAQKYRSEKISQLILANHIVAYSYISLESALAYHGWIPEKVTTIFSVIPSGRNRSFTTAYGDYTYEKISTNKFEFLTGVASHVVNNQNCLVASPLRALADYIYLRKPKENNLDFLQQSLRIEAKDLATITAIEIETLKKAFKTKKVIQFLNKLKRELKK